MAFHDGFRPVAEAIVEISAQRLGIDERPGEIVGRRRGFAERGLGGAWPAERALGAPPFAHARPPVAGFVVPSFDAFKTSRAITMRCTSLGPS